jgi:hypothetical protein
MIGYCASRISEHMARDGAGQLLCLSVPIAREGQQQYRASEIGISNSDDLVTVMRPASEVFSRAAMASFEGLPLTDDHPATFIRPENWSNYARGHVQNVREGKPLPSGERALIADLVVSDGNLISKIEAGKRDISCGYICDYYELPDGTWEQCNLRGNHISVVLKGRALNTKILDSGKDVTMTEADRQKLVKALEGLRDFFSRRTADNGAREMLADAERISRRLTTTVEGPGSLHEFITQPSSIALREEQRARGEDFEKASRVAGVRARARWGYAAEDCRPSLRRVSGDVTAAEDFEAATRARRKQLLGR